VHERVGLLDGGEALVGKGVLGSKVFFVVLEIVRLVAEEFIQF
jgi:hypothetical protein